MTGIGLFLKVLVVRRPCDGTSGLVRGNRRKAVFAFKGLFALGRLARFSLSGARFTAFFRKCGEKSETTEHNPIFANKTAGRGSRNLGCLATIAIWQMKKALRGVTELLRDNE